MKQKQLKLESYLFLTNFLLGVFWMLSGCIEILQNDSLIAEIINLALMLVLLGFILKGLFSPSERFDELSRKIKNSTDSSILCLSLPLIILLCECINILQKFDISINIPWYAIVKIIVGILFCLQYIVFVIKIKKISDFTGEEDA